MPMRAHSAVGCIFGIALSVGACGGRDQAPSAADEKHGTATVGGGVVSTVDGHPITLHDVQELVKAGLSAPDALARLQAERLLMADAERRGYGATRAVEQVAEQARVQALLAAEADAVTLTDDEVRAAYAQHKERYEKPERRASVHVLAMLRPKVTPEAEAAAKAAVQRAMSDLAAAQDFDAFIREQKARSTPELSITAEILPPFDRSGGLVKPYLDAMFSVAQPGVVPEPVRTSFGWHAIRVTEILPSETTPYEKVEADLRQEVLLARRAERVQQLVERLRKAYAVEVAPDVGQTLAKLTL
jgi:parvulin-like peptidyl-prolyl isomerase